MSFPFLQRSLSHIRGGTLRTTTGWVNVWLAVFVLVILGCGKRPMHNVEGKIRLAGKPVVGCKVGFFPDVDRFNPEWHGFGFGVTGSDGRYAIQHPQGEAGILAGRYKVTLVAWVNAAGEVVAADVKPSEVEGGVRNIFPVEYESPSTTPARADVRNGGPNVFDFQIEPAVRK